MIYKFKDKFHLYIVFHKKTYGILQVLYKIFFLNKYTHIDIILDGLHEIECSFDKGISIITYDKKTKPYSNDYDVIEIVINEKQYYDMLNLTSRVNGFKYDYLSIVKNLFVNDLNKKNKLICTELTELILKEINININNRYSIHNLYKNVLKQLKANKFVFINY